MAALTPKLITNQRRNGKLSSCEPCRKGKLRCDHTTPTCGRCARLKKHALCIYHPAPLTKKRPSETPTPTPQSPSNSSQVQTTYSSQSQDSNQQEIDDISNSPYSIFTSQLKSPSSNDSTPIGPSCQPPRPIGIANVYRTSTGYLGSTSYAAVLDENEGMVEPESDLSDIRTAPIGEGLINRGVEILVLLKDTPIFERYLDRWFTLTQGGLSVIEPIIKPWAKLLWDSHGPLLARENQSELRELSERVWRNTKLMPMVNASTTPQEFVSMFSGPNLRWEVVGIIISLVGNLILWLSEYDPIFESTSLRLTERRNFALKMYDLAETCVQFCKKIPALNDMYAWLLSQIFGLRSQLYGDQDYIAWQMMGEAVDTCVALGLHQDIRQDRIPFFLAQIRMRYSSSTYMNEIWFATFTGRPPRISKRYCNLQMPLDLNSDEIMAEGVDLERNLQSLDENGWNKEGLAKRSSWLRLGQPLFEIREDILEITLGVSNENIIERVDEISKRATSYWHSLPKFLRKDSRDWNFGKLDFLVQIHAKLVYLYNHFLLKRVLIKRTGASSEQLVIVSREIFSIVCEAIERKDVFRDYQADFIDCLYSFGIPSAAVIAIELLKQTQGLGLIDSNLDRSENIQDLSVFIACLKSVRPQQGGYHLCQHGMRFLKKVLDKVLSPKQEPLTDLLPTAQEWPMVDQVIPFGNDADFLQWLETVDWEKTPLPAF